MSLFISIVQTYYSKQVNYLRALEVYPDCGQLKPLVFLKHFKLDI